MANVYLARAQSPDGQEHAVVIKRLVPQYAHDPDFMKMFLDEIQISVRLSHPNVVQVVEAVSVGSEVLLVLELVRGLSLATILNAAHRRESRLSPAVIAAIGAQIAAGLHHAHELRDDGGNPMRVIHRDVSPQNIMITREGVAKLLDFGVAHLLGRMSHTNPGVTKGKVGYLSPEQRAHQPIDHRTDIFSLGVVLWEALTGHRLFSVANGPSKKVDWYEPVIPASVYRPTAPELSRTIMRALEWNPDDRFQSAEAMRLELQTFAESSHVGPAQVAAYFKGVFAQPKVKPKTPLQTGATQLARPSALKTRGALAMDRGEARKPASGVWERPPATRRLLVFLLTLVLLLTAGLVTWLRPQKLIPPQATAPAPSSGAAKVSLPIADDPRPFVAPPPRAATARTSTIVPTIVPMLAEGPAPTVRSGISHRNDPSSSSVRRGPGRKHRSRHR